MKIVITPRGFVTNGQQEIKWLSDQGIIVDANDTGKQYDEVTLAEKLKDADGLIVGVDIINKEIIDRAPNLKVICKFGVGVDNIDLDYAKSKGIVVERTLGSNSNAVAEHCFMMLISYFKNYYSSIKEVKEGLWNKQTGEELVGKTLGIIGYGSIGKILSKFATAFKMDVLVYDVLEHEDVHQVSLSELISKSDVISLHVPLIDSTRNLISLNEFKAMKRNCVLINAARGGIVNEVDLLYALQENLIQAALFDVLENEPPKKEEPLLKCDNFYLTPHTAARTVQADMNTCRISANKISKVLIGKEMS